MFDEEDCIYSFEKRQQVKHHDLGIVVALLSYF